MKKPVLILLTTLFFVSACTIEDRDVVPTEDNTMVELQEEKSNSEDEKQDTGLPPKID